MTALSITTVRGPEVQPYLADLARLRIEVFREYPYLYDGDAAYEERYLTTYASSPESLFVLARDRERIIGASTGVPMAHEEASFKQPFAGAGHDPERIFYLGESVLSGAYRGRGVGVRFFEEREAFARSLGRFDAAVFCAVERPADDPRRPADYQPLDAFWRRRGYEKTGLRTAYAWKEIGEQADSPKPMVFWMKRLEAR